jgi:hypothetical protein
MLTTAIPNMLPFRKKKKKRKKSHLPKNKKGLGKRRQTLLTSAKLTSLSMYDSRNDATQCM